MFYLFKRQKTCFSTENLLYDLSNWWIATNMANTGLSQLVTFLFHFPVSVCVLCLQMSHMISSSGPFHKFFHRKSTFNVANSCSKNCLKIQYRPATFFCKCIAIRKCLFIFSLSSFIDITKDMNACNACAYMI